MAPDLKDYVHFDSKISPSLLGHGEAEVPKFRILAAYMLDFFAVCFCTFLINAILDVQFSQQMLTKGLKLAWGSLNTDPTSLSTLATVSFSYFFFSFFFNHGQSWGMYQMKIRYVMQAHDFHSALRATYSTLLLYFSFGALIGRVQKSISRQDYLYAELVRYREMPARSLVEAIEEYETDEIEEMKAA